MIYFDNAATSLKKPDQVIKAVTEALCSFGNPGRGAHQGALSASRTVYEARSLLAELFNGENPSRIAFTANATEALNMAIKGIIKPGDHVITTEMEHNSVLRPLYEMDEMGAKLSIVQCGENGSISCRDIEQSIQADPRAIVCTHASNVTGNLIDIEEVGRIARRHNVLFILDASQTAGIFPIDVKKMNIDILCFTGHKGLLGPQGTGGIYVREGIELRPLLSGGSGVQSFSRTQPGEMPTVLEAGTLNAHGIAGLSAGVRYIMDTGIDEIRRKELELMWYFYEEAEKIEGIKIYGDFSERERCPVVSLNIRDYDSAVVSDALFNQYGIAVRPGAHCAPLMHKALETQRPGAVRFSFAYCNTLEEVEMALEGLWRMAKV